MLPYFVQDVDELKANRDFFTAAPAMARELHRAHEIFKSMAITKGSKIGCWNWPILEQETKAALLAAGYTEEIS